MVNSCSRRYPAADMPWSGAEESHLISSHLTLRLRHCGWFVARHTSFFFISSLFRGFFSMRTRSGTTKGMHAYCCSIGRPVTYYMYTDQLSKLTADFIQLAQKSKYYDTPFLFGFTT